MTSSSSVRLYEAEPSVLRFLGPADAERAGLLRLPVQTLGKGEVHVNSLLHKNGAFGAILLDGMLLQSLRLSGHVGLRPLGPGDVLALTRSQQAMLPIESAHRVVAPVSIALMERELLLAIRRWPGIAAGLHAHIGEQSERAAKQLMIAQLPRVGDRLLSLLWLLAESWGQVTPRGTLLPVPLTHATLGGLIGARRATVTLAVGSLAEAGLISREPRGWMLHRAAFEAPTPVATAASVTAD
jgi:CRP/FNR family transcriptional regulator, cyclic AMP receptor protein